MADTPGPATNLVVVAKTSTDVTLTWAAPMTVVMPARYRVRYRPGSSGPWIMHSMITTTTRMVVDGLTPNTLYQFEVLVNNGN